jgi:hypothetical protein
MIRNLMACGFKRAREYRIITWKMIEKAVDDLKPLYSLANENIDKGIGLFAANVYRIRCTDILTPGNIYLMLMI